MNHRAYDSDSAYASSSVSDSDDTSEDDTPNVCSQPRSMTSQLHHQESQYTESLGRMLPVHQHSLHVENNYVRTYNIVVNSRNRNVLKEHLFSFAVHFGAVSKVCDAPEMCEPEPYDDCRACAQLCTDAQDTDSTDENTQSSVPCQVLSSVTSCTVDRTFNNVQEVYVSNVLIPNISFLEHIADTSALPETPISLHPPQEVYIEMTPNGNRRLYATDSVSNRCSFVCAPTEATDVHRRYETMNDPYSYDTPVNYLNHIDIRVHSLLDRLQYKPFVSSQRTMQSPDVFAMYSVTYVAATKVLHVKLLATDMSRLSDGHIVSLVNVSFLDTESINNNEDNQKVYSLLCTLHDRSYVVTNVDTPSETSPTHSIVSLSLSTLQLPEHLLPSQDSELLLNAQSSVMVNESMQYTILMQLKCAERRLHQI